MHVYIYIYIYIYINIYYNYFFVLGQNSLPEIFESLRLTHQSISSRLTASIMLDKVNGNIYIMYNVS